MENNATMIDPMTGFLTKQAFQNIVQKKLETGELNAKDISCVYFDIKAFKLFYTRTGFDMGYECLISVGNDIKEGFKGDDLCRSTNDHFILVTKREGLMERITSVQEIVHEKWKHTGLELTAGSYEPAEDETDMVLICSNAKVACKSAEKSGGSFGKYDGELESSIRLKQYVIHHFDEAIEKEQIELYFQPIMHAVSGRLCGYEALARWQSAQYGLLMPDDFLNALVEAKQVHRLDSYIIEKVCMEIKRYIDEGRVAVPISVNLSRQDFVLVDMLEEVEKAVDKYSIPKEYLSLELAEGILSEDREDMEKELARFKAAGFNLTIDDFGGVVSSLHVLKDMTFDALKIDSRFIEGEGESVRARIILKNIMNMAKELGIQTMMDSIEREDTVRFLKQIGCEKVQGNVFGEPDVLNNEVHEKLLPENDFERDYFDAIGKVNVLSQNPMKTGWSYQDEDSAMNNLLPISLMEFDGKCFKVLMANDNFCSIFVPASGDEASRDVEDLFNNTRFAISDQFRVLAEQCVFTGTESQQDFATEGGYYRITMRCVSYNIETDNSAILAVIERMSEDDPKERGSKMDSAMRFLYSLYSRVDIIDADAKSFDNIYIDTSRYNNPVLTQTDLIKSIRKFADQNIYPEDREKYVGFLNLSTMEERLKDVGGRYMVDYFRTRNAKGQYDWLMYMVLPIVSQGQNMYMICSRGIDAERMRRLPEISQSGAEYYDFPGNPVFLILASSAFTKMLDYGSFDEFLRNSFFVEANISDNSVLNLHLGKQEIMGQDAFGSMGIPYDEVMREMILGSVIDDQKESVREFFDRDRLLKDYHEGKVSSNVEYLRLPDWEKGGQPRYMNVSYQLRENRDGMIHIYIIAFDVDDYRRTNETIHRLAERDTLTGLYNRSTSGALFEKILKDGDTREGALIILDLDNFKQINDRYGHDCGDKILKDASERMSSIFEEFGYVARIGGDEFLAIVRNISDQKVDEILGDFTDTIKIVDYHDQQINYTMSIGYAMFPVNGREYNELYQNADMALYAVKMHGRNSFNRYRTDMAGINRSHLGFNKNSILEEMPGGILVYRNNENTEILYANNRLISIYDCEDMEQFRELTNNSFRGCVYDEDWEFVQECIDRHVVSTGGYDYVQYRAVTRNGRIINIEDYGRLYRSEAEGEMFYVFMLDLDDRERTYGHVIEKFKERS